jgi:hypothetical protein
VAVDAVHPATGTRPSGLELVNHVLGVIEPPPPQLSRDGRGGELHQSVKLAAFAPLQVRPLLPAPKKGTTWLLHVRLSVSMIPSLKRP